MHIKWTRNRHLTLYCFNYLVLSAINLAENVKNVEELNLNFYYQYEAAKLHADNLIIHIFYYDLPL